MPAPREPMRNVEIKARVKSLDDLHQAAAQVSGGPPKLIEQEDIFFNCDEGRLKLRLFSETEGQLIYYQRKDSSGPKISNYEIAPITSPTALGEVLSLAYGLRGIVKKKRWLYMYGKTRIHLDEVDSLGSFMELEIVLTPDQSASEGKEIANRLMGFFGIGPDDLVDNAYIDLLESMSRSGELKP